MKQPMILTAGQGTGWRAAASTVIAIALAWLGACASTQLKDTWKDPAFTGPPMKQVLVIGASKSEVNRRVFEDAFAGALKGAGTAAVPSYPTLPEAGAVSNERVGEAVKSSGADAVLVTRVLRVRRTPLSLLFYHKERKKGK